MYMSLTLETSHILVLPSKLAKPFAEKARAYFLF